MPVAAALYSAWGWGVSSSLQSLMSMRGETEAHEGSRMCTRTMLELGMGTSHALA